ncbi:MAG TPA: response regulator transcription factor [Flavisolibacter sp.]|nr:response regulator transcription factor [Flavisolibacter sp.]
MEHVFETEIYRQLLAAKIAETAHLPLQKPSDPPIDLLVADHSLIFYRGIKALLTSQAPDSFILTGGVTTGRGLIEKLQTHKPQLVMIDVSLPQGNGIDTAAWVKQHYPGIKLLATSDFESPVEVQLMIRAGADGFITKNCSAEELILALRTAHAGGRYFGIGVHTSLAEEEVDGSNEKRKG